MNRRRLLRLIGKDCPVPIMVTEDQGAGDIMKRMILKHKKCAEDYDNIANEFSDGSVYVICERLFEFCKNNIYYSEESIDVQSISAPQTILTRGHCDCKGYALFIGGVLDSLKRSGYPINWCYRFASYKIFDETPGHVFVVMDPGTQNEVWIDPVLKRFNDHKEYCYHIDRKVKAETSKISGCNCNNHAIGTTQQTGAALMKLAPALSEVPVAALVVEAAGLVLNFFGSKYTTSNDVRWLTAKFQYYVLGDGSAVSNHHANEAYTQQAAKWFSYVTGVPVLDQLRYHALRGTSPQTGKTMNLTRTQRAQNYLNSAPDAVQQGVTLQDAVNATYNADQFKENGIDGNYPPGSWKNFLAAPELISQDEQGANLSVNSSGQLVSQGVPTTNKSILYIGAAVIAAYLLLSK